MQQQLRDLTWSIGDYLSMFYNKSLLCKTLSKETCNIVVRVVCNTLNQTIYNNFEMGINFREGFSLVLVLAILDLIGNVECCGLKKLTKTMDTC